MTTNWGAGGNPYAPAVGMRIELMWANRAERPDPRVLRENSSQFVPIRVREFLLHEFPRMIRE